ncbi:hypothetical protein [Rhodovulum sp. MB263]|uniref:hypothetical protein n=1 Tax=Rhodovulum sp. (strain MB263) TaxID=308754 RepID=UPI0009B74C4D|nr:hypothetical protein [Rhodovulum sp. MB263]ARC88418.1 hypothetical protein B5V46_07210 [Rhodovulum sp. MB263]
MPIVFMLTSIMGGVFSATVVSLIMETGWGAILLSYWLGGMVWGGAAVSCMALRPDKDDSDAEAPDYEVASGEDARPGAREPRGCTARSRASDDVEKSDRCDFFF